MRPLHIIGLLMFGVLAGCRYPEQHTGISVRVQEKAKVSGSARLTLLTDPDMLEQGENQLSFAVSDYTLGIKSPGERATEIAESAKGQHIHLILDNAPYMAKYQTDFSLNLDTGQHVLLAFLSRSYHESLKTESAYVLRQFRIGDGTETPYDFGTGPHLFYSRPKGTYHWKDGQSQPILLDFYLLNAQLEHGAYIKATINGSVFRLKEWKPYYIEGLTPGAHSIQLELMDKNDRRVPGPFNNSGKRTFTLKSE